VIVFLNSINLLVFVIGTQCPFTQANFLVLFIWISSLKWLSISIVFGSDIICQTHCKYYCVLMDRWSSQRGLGGRSMWNTWERTVCRLLMGKPERKSSFGRLDIYGRIIWIVLDRNGMGGCGLDSSGWG